jgi:hypothetical protein
VNPSEHEAVKEVLLDRLHTTEDEELQAALWQLLELHDRQEVQLAGVRAGLALILREI